MGEKGIFLYGGVTPPLSDVKVRLQRETEKEGIQDFRAVTDANGAYRSGQIP